MRHGLPAIEVQPREDGLCRCAGEELEAALRVLNLTRRAQRGKSPREKAETMGGAARHHPPTPTTHPGGRRVRRLGIVSGAGWRGAKDITPCPVLWPSPSPTPHKNQHSRCTLVVQSSATATCMPFISTVRYHARFATDSWKRKREEFQIDNIRHHKIF